jgi:hypothetical protein
MVRKAGPIEHKKLPNGKLSPFYLIRFDKHGEGETPKSKDHLLKTLEIGDYTDVYLFSHGWENNPKRARYHPENARSLRS